MRTYVGKIKTRPQGRGNGFTLVELLLVAVLIAVLAAIGAPRFSGGVRALGLKDSAARLSEEIRAARLEALRRQLKVRFEVHPDSGGYGFLCQQREPGLEVSFVPFQDPYWDERRHFPAGVTLDRIEQDGRALRPPILLLEPSGVMVPTVIRLVDGDGRSARIALGFWVDDVRLVYGDDERLAAHEGAS